jgi:HSP20 family protein
MAKEKKSFFEKIISSPSVSKKGIEIKKDADVSEDREIEIENKSSQNTEEGQLSVDVYETDSAIAVVSIIGGIGEEDINVSVDNNVLTITGAREKDEEQESRNYFVAECFWGPFSRSIILPVEVDVERVKAIMKNGILKVILPKLGGKRSKKIKIEKE